MPGPNAGLCGAAEARPAGTKVASTQTRITAPRSLEKEVIYPLRRAALVHLAGRASYFGSCTWACFPTRRIGYPQNIGRETQMAEQTKQHDQKTDQARSESKTESKGAANKCPECGEPVEDLRATCANCGYEYKDEDYADPEAGNEFLAGSNIDDEGEEITDKGPGVEEGAE
jgi:ribosomal protein L32